MDGLARLLVSAAWVVVILVAAVSLMLVGLAFAPYGLIWGPMCCAYALTWLVKLDQ